MAAQCTQSNISVSLQTMMGDQRFTCGRYKNRTFEEIAKNDADFCESVLKTAVCNKYYPEDFKSYLQSLRRPSIHETNVTGFIHKWDENMEAEFRKIIGSPKIEIKKVHPAADGYPNGNLGVFIRYFFKKCIFNLQNADASSYNIELFATIFPFKVSKMVPPARLPVRELFDEKFHATIATFMVHHFENKCDSAASIVDLFLRNIYDFKKKHFDECTMRKLKNVVNDAVDSDKSFFTVTYANDYLRQFPRLSTDGVYRYTQLRQMYNSLCAAFGHEDLGDQRRRHIRMLPEINCYELLLLLEPDFYMDRQTQYIEWFQKYLFFFAYAVESADNAVFFIDDPLYECMKGYVQYRTSREVPENLKLCVWLVTLIHRRTQPLDKSNRDNFEVDDQNLQHIRNYVENFPGIESAIVDFSLPTSLLLLGIPIVTKDTTINVFYTKSEKSKLSDFYEVIIRALMCPMNIKKICIYNAYSGVETSMMVPPLKKEVLEFVRQYNNYDPAQILPVEHIFTHSLEQYFEKSTIQWYSKYPRKTNTLPVYDYKEIFGDA